MTKENEKYIYGGIFVCSLIGVFFLVAILIFTFGIVIATGHLAYLGQVLREIFCWVGAAYMVFMLVLSWWHLVRLEKELQNDQSKGIH